MRTRLSENAFWSAPSAALASAWPVVISAAALLTFFNALKPLTIDDTAYYYLAKQLSAHPTDPYGFEIFWGQQPVPAVRIPAPTVLPYWWSLAIRFIGDQTYLWKIWLFPFALVLAKAIHSLLRRFTPGFETPLLLLLVLSPSILPSFNLMLDVPALALALASLSVFLRASEKESMLLAVGAGVLSGLAMQTKYSQVVVLLAILVGALLFRRYRLGLVCSGVAAIVFLGWEMFLLTASGISPFLNTVEVKRNLSHLDLNPLGVAALLGAIGPSIALLGLVGLRSSRSVFFALLCLFSLAFAVIPELPQHWFERLDLPLPGSLHARVGSLVFLPMGVLVTAIVAIACGVLWRQPSRKNDGPGPLTDVRLDRFLLLWSLLELVGIFSFSPNLAVRRALGLLVALTLVAGRLSSRRGLDPQRRRLVAYTAAWAVALGLFFACVDLSDSRMRRAGVYQADHKIRSIPGEPVGDVWYVGHWGFQFYAERLGMKPVIPEKSLLKEGDWLVFPTRTASQRIVRDPAMLQKVHVVRVTAALSWSTIPLFYAGAIPLGPQRDFRVRLFKVLESHVARGVK